MKTAVYTQSLGNNHTAATLNGAIETAGAVPAVLAFYKARFQESRIVIEAMLVSSLVRQTAKFIAVVERSPGPTLTEVALDFLHFSSEFPGTPALDLSDGENVKIVVTGVDPLALVWSLHGTVLESGAPTP